jgi:hypothetical protein
VASSISQYFVEASNVSGPDGVNVKRAALPLLEDGLFRRFPTRRPGASAPLSS